MLPKSLAAAILLGVLASGALGVYFVKLGGEQYELAFVDGPSVSVVVDKPDYKTGEKIAIRIVNSGTEEIGFSKDAPGLKIRALDGTVFFSTSFGLTLGPRGEHVFEWEQQKSDGSRVLEGRYVIEVTAYGTDMQKLDDRLTVNILK